MGSPAISACPLCGKPNLTQAVTTSLTYSVVCIRCGTFLITHTLISILRLQQNAGIERLLTGLSAYTRQESERGNPVKLDTKNWESLALAHSKTPVVQKVHKLLSLVADRSAHPGAIARIPVDDFPLVDAASTSELGFLLEHLSKIGYIETKMPIGAELQCIVTVEGWGRVQEQMASGTPGRCFVAMSFHPSLDDAWEKGIEPALRKDCELDPIKINLVEHNEKICDKLIAEIRLSQFLVADFTLHRAGVYFEAGFALGLGRPVIWTCRKDELEKTHFDTRQYNHIDWETPEELRSRLRDRVIATIPKRNL